MGDTYMKKYRNEWKYECTNTDLEILKSKLDNLLPKDKHSNSDGMYVVHNLYFDDYKNVCALMTEAGDAARYKWRIRYYGDKPKDIKLELKEKIFGRCHKETCMLTSSECKKLIQGNVEDVFWKTDSKLVKRFCIDMMSRLFEPKVIIEYERVAYVDTTLNVRITFDKNISSSYDIDHFLDNDYIKYPLQDKGMFVVEVKFDDILPGYIKELVTKECEKQIAFSKYYNGRKVLEMLK